MNSIVWYKMNTHVWQFMRCMNYTQNYTCGIIVHVLILTDKKSDVLKIMTLKDVRSCVLRTFLDRSSISQILHHISFLLVNLGFTMPIKLYWNKKIATKYNIINIRWGTMFCIGRFFRRKFIIFLFWCVNSIVHLNSYFSMQAA